MTTANEHEQELTAPVTWRPPHVTAEYRRDLEAVRLEISTWTKSIDESAVKKLREELIEDPLREAVRRCLAGSSKRVAYHKLLREKTTAKLRKEAAETALRRLCAERAYRLEAREEGFAQAVVLLDEEIVSQEQIAARAARELELIEPLATRAFRDATDEIGAHANAAGPQLVSMVVQRIAALRSQLFASIQGQLSELAQLIVVVDGLETKFETMALGVLLESYSYAEPQSTTEPDSSAPGDPANDTPIDAVEVVVAAAGTALCAATERETAVAMMDPAEGQAERQPYFEVDG